VRIGIRAESCSICVVSIGRKAETYGAVVAFSTSRIELRKPCGAAKEEDQNPSCQGIKRPQMTDLAKAEDPAGRFDHVVRSESARLVDDKSAVIGSQTRLADHRTNLPEGGPPHPHFCASADSKGDDNTASYARSPLNPMLNSAPERAAVKPIFGKFGARKNGVVRLTPPRGRAGKNRTLETEGCGTRTAPS